jgi:pimeloyl-ACP methyl ester carboxylesterase
VGAELAAPDPSVQSEARPHLPLGRRVELPRRGTTFVREVKGPPGAPTLLLLHGWIASGGLNWFRTFETLGQHFNVLAPDLRGHARGVRSRKVFRIHDCADDAAEMLVAMDSGPVIAVGYSMGGPVAQQLFRRHRDLVSGLVFCATAPTFLLGQREKLIFTTMMASFAGTTRFGSLALAVPGLARRVQPIAARNTSQGSLPAWAAGEMRRHDWRMIIEAGHSLGTYNARHWIHDVDVPTTVMVTEKDKAIPTHVQMELAERIPGATVISVDDGHTVCAKESFAPPLLQACLQVAARAERHRFVLGPADNVPVPR